MGLVLGGGGARGISQIGAIKAFTEAGEDVVCSVNTDCNLIV